MVTTARYLAVVAVLASNAFSLKFGMVTRDVVRKLQAGCCCSGARHCPARASVSSRASSSVSFCFVRRVRLDCSTRPQARRDARGTLAAELLRTIKLVKLHGAEAAWEARVRAARTSELRALTRLRYISAFR